MGMSLASGLLSWGDHWLQRWSRSAGWREEAGAAENLLESSQPGLDYQSGPLLGPGDSGKLFNLFCKLRVMTSTLHDC